MYMQVYSIIGW